MMIQVQNLMNQFEKNVIIKKKPKCFKILYLYNFFITKIQQKIDGRNHHMGDKKGRPKKDQKTHSLQEHKKKGES
jgi:hypothetical protein